MYSTIQQEKTILRDARGMTVYRRLYLCDTTADVATLPVEDAPGSATLVAAGGAIFLLDHGGIWQAAGAWQPATLADALPGGGVR